MMQKDFVVDVIGMIVTTDVPAHHMKKCINVKCICTIIQMKLINLIKHLKNGRNRRQKVRVNDMGEIINIEQNMKHEVSELICIKCFHRWIGVYSQKTLLKDIECTCGLTGYVIKTGQTLDIESEVKK